MDDGPMVPHEATALVSAYKSTRGRPKKFQQPWTTMMKRIYISEKSWMDFRKLKETNRFDSDDITMQYLLKRHNLIEDQSLATIGCSTSPAGTRIGSESQPVCHSTPLSTPRAHIEHRRLPRTSLRERLVENMKYDCSWSLHY